MRSIITLPVVIWALFVAPTWCGAANRRRGREIPCCSQQLRGPAARMQPVCLLAARVGGRRSAVGVLVGQDAVGELAELDQFVVIQPGEKSLLKAPVVGLLRLP